MSSRPGSGRGSYGQAGRVQSSQRGRGWRRGSATTVDSTPRTSESNPKLSRSTPLEVSKPQRRMDLMASVSRSSGLEKGGDDLKDSGIQEEYRKFIQQKTDEVVKMFAGRASESEQERKQRIDKQENLLILFRKLREGVSSSSRQDDFALEVYQTSLYYSIIFGSPKQTASILSHVFPSRNTKDLKSSDAIWPSPSIYSALGSLLHFLVASYPSQSMYHQHLASIPEKSLPRNSDISSWLLTITKALRRRDYARFAILSQKSSITKLLDDPGDQKTTNVPSPNSPARYKGDGLAKSAVLFLIDALRQKASDTSWGILRSAYRELWCDQTYAETKVWLQRTLTLEPIGPDGPQFNIESWLKERASLGHLREKEGTDGRWIVCKAR